MYIGKSFNYICVALAMLFFMAALAGCGVKAETAETAEAVTEPAAAPETTSEAKATAAVTEPAATAVIEDAAVDTELLDMAAKPDGGLPPVASVAGYYITQPEYRFMLNSYKSSLLLNSGIAAGSDEDVLFWERAAAGGKTRLEEASEKVLFELHQIKICEAIAESRGVALGQDELENISMDLTAQIDRFGSQEAFEGVLADEYGIGISDYMRFKMSAALRDKLLAEEMESVEVPESEIKEYFEQNGDIYGDKVRIRQILFLAEGADVKSARTAEETKRLAEDTLAALKAGEDMDRLARENSEAPGAGEDGGERVAARADPFTQEEILEWAFAAAEGEYFLLEAAFGYYIVRLEEKIPGAFEDAKPAIEDTLRERKLAARVAEWLKDPMFALIVNQDVLSEVIKM